MARRATTATVGVRRSSRKTTAQLFRSSQGRFSARARWTTDGRCDGYRPQARTPCLLRASTRKRDHDGAFAHVTAVRVAGLRGRSWLARARRRHVEQRPDAPDDEPVACAVFGAAGLVGLGSSSSRCRDLSRRVRRAGMLGTSSRNSARNSASFLARRRAGHVFGEDADASLVEVERAATSGCGGGVPVEPGVEAGRGPTRADPRLGTGGGALITVVRRSSPGTGTNDPWPKPARCVTLLAYENRPHAAVPPRRHGRRGGAAAPQSTVVQCSRGAAALDRRATSPSSLRAHPPGDGRALGDDRAHRGSASCCAPARPCAANTRRPPTGPRSSPKIAMKRATAAAFGRRSARTSRRAVSCDRAE